MTARTDVYIDWEQSPRIIWVEAPSADMALQDLHDTCVALEDSIEGSEHPNLISSAGKEALGGGVTVGITSTLQNAQLAFEPRFAAVTTGTVTTQDTTGKVCICSAETYITDGVARNDVVHNHLDGSHATVLSVDSETQLTTTQLQGGSDNFYDIGDTIIVSPVVQCNISGGNLVAVDDVDAELAPVFPTYGTQIVRTASSSATLADEKELSDIKFLIEQLRPHHPGLGTVFYWNPDTGDDSQNGLAEDTAVKTFAQAHTLCTDGAHDIIVATSGVAGTTTTTETIEITKRYVSIRGPGRDFQFVPTATTVPTVKINAVGAHLKGFVVETAATGGQNSIEVATGADFFHLEELWSNASQNNAIYVSGSVAHGRINGGHFAHMLANGIHLDGNIRHVHIWDTESDDAGTNGIQISGTTARNNIIGEGVRAYGSGAYGIRIDAPALRNYIDSDVALYDNTSGSILDNGTSTQIESQWTTNLTEDYPVDGQSSTTPAQMLYSINQMLSEFARTGTTVSIKKRDGTEAFQLTLDSATAPTTSTQSS